MHSVAVCIWQTMCTGLMRMYLTMAGTRLPHQKCPFVWVDIDPQLTHGSLDPQESASQKTASPSVTSVPNTQTHQTDRQTYTQTTLSATSVVIGRIHALRVCSVA